MPAPQGEQCGFGRGTHQFGDGSLDDALDDGDRREPRSWPNSARTSTPRAPSWADLVMVIGETERLLRFTRDAGQRATRDAVRAAAAELSGTCPPAGLRRPPAPVRAGRSPLRKWPVFGVLSTAHDRRADGVRAGQALERVLLVAAAHDVPASLLRQALEWPDLREQFASTEATATPAPRW
ncbi:hypothetical protein ACIHIX_37035 [Streptomyces sp. NPDC051913]|uniref:hypothetical protein n=1 Tax=Streptomyces sp. NPDC051913 TaxID=3365676 RepID=UPI0037D08607